jgi:hypothetical protein
MAGPLRWVLFFGVIVLAVAAVAVLWLGLTEEIAKGLASFAVVAIAAAALYALRPRA